MKLLFSLLLFVFSVNLFAGDHDPDKLFCNKNNFTEFINNKQKTDKLIKETGKGCNLKSADLEGAYLKGAYLRRADLSNANLKQTNLSGADLKGSNLSKAYLMGAIMIGAYLIGAYLKKADFSNADLSGSDMTNTNGESANFNGAKLQNVRTEGASFAGATLTGAQTGTTTSESSSARPAGSQEESKTPNLRCGAEATQISSEAEETVKTRCPSKAVAPTVQNMLIHCVEGDAKFDKDERQGIFDSSLLVCQHMKGKTQSFSFKLPTTEQLSIFFNNFKNVTEFKQQAKTAMGISFENILAYMNEKLKAQRYEGQQLKAKNQTQSNALKYLAYKYREFTQKSLGTPIKMTQFRQIANQHKQTIRSADKTQNPCAVQRIFKILRVEFKDGDVQSILPVSLKSASGRYELTFYYMPVNPQTPVKRTLIASGEQIQWVGSDNLTTYPVERLELYNAKGQQTWQSPSPCKLKQTLEKRGLL